MTTETTAAKIALTIADIFGKTPTTPLTVARSAVNPEVFYLQDRAFDDFVVAEISIDEEGGQTTIEYPNHDPEHPETGEAAFEIDDLKGFAEEIEMAIAAYDRADYLDTSAEDPEAEYEARTGKKA